MTAPQRDPKARSDRAGIGGVFTGIGGVFTGIVGGVTGVVTVIIAVVGIVGVVASVVTAIASVAGIVVGVVGGGFAVVIGVRVIVAGVDDLVRSVRQLRYREGRHRERTGDRQVARMPLRMAEWSVWVLPAENRPRYRHEIEAELFELRDQSGRVQLIYAMRLLVRSVALRRALQHSARMVQFQKQDW